MCQYVANIRIFECIQIFIDEYIHSLNYLWIFPKQIYSDIHLRLLSPHEYIWTFIVDVRSQQTHWFEAAQENKKKFIKKNLGKMTFQQLMFDKNYPVLISYLIFTIRLYSFAKIFSQYFSY